MTINYAYLGDVAPATLSIVINQGDSALDMTTVTAASLKVRKPDTNVEVTWTVNIVSQAATTMTIRRTLTSTDFDVAGAYRFVAVLSVPGGTLQAGPVSMDVLR